MDKKEIQAKRKREYFIEAAKEIVREEGVSDLTVKKVADKAGYAQGTLYNYFDSLNDLLFYCIIDFFTECKEFVLKRDQESVAPAVRVINLARTYSEYFLQNPNVYRLAFLTDLGSPPEEIAKSREYRPEIVKILRASLDDCVGAGLIKPEEKKNIRNLIGNCIHGNLLFFINDKIELTAEKVLEQIEKDINYLLAD